MIKLLGIKNNRIQNNIITNDWPKPTLDQLTVSSLFFKASTTGETRLDGGNMHSLHFGHWYPAGAVLDGNSDAYLSIHDQWNTSLIYKTWY